MNPVERLRIAALLQVTQDGLPHFKQTLAFLLEQGAHEACGVQRIGMFVADEQGEASGQGQQEIPLPDGFRVALALWKNSE